MKKYQLLAAVFLALPCSTLACNNSYAADQPIAGETITFQNSSENFLNPERGFHQGFQLMETATFSGVRKAGSSMITAYVRLDPFIDRPLSQDFLNRLRSRLDAVRTAGLKIVPRFTYNFPLVDDFCPASDAPLSRVQEHIGQLKLIFEEYKDVIMAVQAGFIGAWGEWHCSSSGLDTRENKKKVLDALLAVVPQDRMVQIRYMDDLAAFYPSPLSAQRAFDGSNQARVGFHNDCFLANQSDAGTYKPSNQIAAQKEYAAQFTEFVPVGGETCQVTPEEWRTQCATTLREMAQQHWSFISGTWYEPIIDQWKSEGCYNEIARRLGYRFTLTRAVIPDRVNQGGRLKLSLEIKNEGFAAPFNPRPVQIVLRNRASKAAFSMNVSTDPRRWEGGSTNTVVVDVPLPGGLAKGDYEVFLYLPDASPRLASRPEYAIRFANQNVWEAATGYNSLQQTLQVQ